MPKFECTQNALHKTLKQSLLTFALLTYNQQEFVREAIRGAYTQTYIPLEIIISDDCSTDRTYSIIQEEIAWYNGPHRIILNQNTSNLGIGAHINHIVNLASGELIIIAAGDDISLANRTEKIFEKYKQSNKKAKSIFSNMIVIDEHNVRHGVYRITPNVNSPLQWMISRSGGVGGASQAFSKALFDIFDNLPGNLIQEDMVIPFRAALVGEIEFIDEPLVFYRRHQNNLSKPMGDLRNIETLLANYRMKACDRNTVYETWLSDIEKIKPRHYKKKRLLNSLSLLIKQKLEANSYEMQLFESPFRKRIKIIGEAFKQGIAFKVIRRWLFISISPELFLIYLRLKRWWLLRNSGNDRLII